MFDDDDARPAKPEYRIGQDLALMSIGDLTATIAALKAEITRLEADISAKQGTRATAESLFRS